VISKRGGKVLARCAQGTWIERTVMINQVKCTLFKARLVVIVDDTKP